MIASFVIAIGRSDRLEAMRRGFTSKTEPGSGVWTSLVIVVVVGLLAMLVLLFLNRTQQNKEQGKSESAHALFKHVLSQLKLGLQDRSLLRRVATELKLKNPTVMLLTPQIFAETSFAYIAKKPGQSRADMARLQTVFKQIFRQDMPKPQAEKAITVAPDL